MNEHAEAQALLPVIEACRRLGIGRSTFYKEMEAGRIKTVTIGARRMVAPADLDAYVDRLRNAVT